MILDTPASVGEIDKVSVKRALGKKIGPAMLMH
jgi:hypothetical protein